MINDAQVRQLIARAIPSIDPSKLEVCMVDYDAAAAYWYRDGDRTLHGRAPAIQSSEAEIAYTLAADLNAHFISEAIAVASCIEDSQGISPYEGKRGKHPKNCTCSKHKAMNGPQ